MTGNSQNDEYKVFNDPVHGTIVLHPLLVKIIDTPEFQRLRHISQLGGVYYVYPGTGHNRFEHSIGTAHLAGKLVRHLKDVHSKDDKEREGYVEIGISEKDILCVEIAGLCHDLGHGPFSHLFDKKFVKALPENSDERIRKWKHEQGSCAMLTRIMKHQSVKDYIKNMGSEVKIGDGDLEFVKAMIKPKYCDLEKIKDRVEGKEFLLEIICNEKCEVDVDKWDYFARDCYHLGIANGFDHNRFIEFTRVVKDEDKLRICVRDKEVFNLYEMFHTRFALHKRAYQHKAVNAMEFMICDALVKANSLEICGDGNGKSKISECVMEQNLGSFCNLDDRILQTIEHSGRTDLEPARKILKRIATGDHYRCVGSKIFRKHFTESERKKIETEIQDKIEELLRENSSFAGTIKASIITFNYGKGNDDPIDYCRFYSKKSPNVAKKIKREDVSTLLPSIFQEFWIQVFCTKENLTRDQLENAENAFENWYKNHVD